MRQTSERRYTNARQRAEQQSSRAYSTCLRIPDGVNVFKPKAGTMFLDILPYQVGKGNPYADEGSLHWERTYWAHRAVGGNQDIIVCPRMTLRQPCPICEYRATLMKSGDDDKEQLIRDLAPKQRQLFNVIDLKDPDRGVQVWDISYHLFGKILDARIRNSDEEEGWDRFFHLEDGWTLRVGFTEKSFGGINYVEAETIDFRPRKQSYSDDILEKTLCLDDLFVHLSYEQIRDMFYQSEPAAVPMTKEEEEDEVPYTYPKTSTRTASVTSPAPKQVEQEEEEEEEEEDSKPEPTPRTLPKKEPSKKQETEEEDWSPPARKSHAEPAAKTRPPAKTQLKLEEEDEDLEEEEEVEPVRDSKSPGATRVIEDEEDEDGDEEEIPEEEDEEDGWEETEKRVKKQPPSPAPKKPGKAKLNDDDWE